MVMDSLGLKKEFEMAMNWRARNLDSTSNQSHWNIWDLMASFLISLVIFQVPYI